MKRQQFFWRIAIYFCGLMLSVTGVSMATRTGLGISPITSFPFSLAQAMGWTMAVVNFILYMVMVAVQFVLRGKNRRWKDLLQIPMSIVFNVVLGWFEVLIPFQSKNLLESVLLLAGTVVLCGVGVSMMVNMDIVANPPDNLAKTISDVSGKKLGLIKNIMDAIFVSMAICIDVFLGDGLFSSVGVGTVVAMVFIGRFVAVTDHFFKEKMLRLAGLDKH